MPRTLIETTATYRKYRVTTAGGALLGFDVETILTPEMTNEGQIRAQAANALATNRDFIALSPPTNAQVVAQVKALSRQNNGIIRLLLGALDATD